MEREKLLQQHKQEPDWWGAALLRWTWGGWWLASWAGARSVSWQQSRLGPARAVLTEPWPGDRGSHYPILMISYEAISSILHLVLSPPIGGRQELSRVNLTGPPSWSGAGCLREAWEIWVCSAWEEMDFGGCNTNPLYLPGGHQIGRVRILPEAHVGG